MATIVNHHCDDLQLCDPPIHCVELLVDPSHDAAALHAIYSAYAAEYGWQVVSVQPAPGADIATWQAKMQELVCTAVDGVSNNHLASLEERHLAPGELPPDGFQPWLAFVQPWPRER